MNPSRHRRHLVFEPALSALLGLPAARAWAQGYPDKPLRLIVLDPQARTLRILRPFGNETFT